MNKIGAFIILIIFVAISAVLLLNKNNTTTVTPTITLNNPSPTTAVLAATSAASVTTFITPNVSLSPNPTGFVTNATTAVVKTVKGDISLKLYPSDAPKTVTNFATLADRGYYNNLTFHRVEPGFVIQGGDPNGDGTGGTSIYGPTFEDELQATSPSYQAGYKEGVVAMANRGPNTNGSQFFIMLADNASLPHNYTIFGKVTNGMNVVKKIQIGDKILNISAQ